MVTAEPVVGWIIGSTPALAEAAAYTGDLDQVRAVVTPALAAAAAQGEPWLLGELAYWLSHADGPAAVPQRAAEPYRLQLSGRPRESAERWHEIGCPYEAALALADTDDEGMLREALAAFDRLGARPMRDITARRLQPARGARHPQAPVPRCRPRRTEHPRAGGTHPLGRRPAQCRDRRRALPVAAHRGAPRRRRAAQARHGEPVGSRSIRQAKRRERSPTYRAAVDPDTVIE